MRTLLKRAIRRLAVFVLLFLVPVLAARVTGGVPPPAGFYMERSDPMSARVAEHLLANGFTEVGDPEDITEYVRLGELDCGAVFPADFGDRVAEGNLEQCIAFYASPSSFSPELYKNHIAAAVFRECAPYISASVFEGTEVTEEEVIAEYETMLAGGYVFSFDVETVSGGLAPERIKTRSLVMGTSAILLFTVLFALCAESLENSFRKVLTRIGLYRSVTAVLLPEATLNTLLAAAACSGGVCAAGFSELVLPVVLHSLLLCGAGLFLAAILNSARWVYTLLPALVIGSVVLCPVYMDVALVLPAAAVIRNLLPAYWLWLIPEAPGLWVFIAVLAFAVGILSVTAIENRCRHFRTDPVEKSSR